MTIGSRLLASNFLLLTRLAYHSESRGGIGSLRASVFYAHLRLCLSCGHVGCCGSSLNRHAWDALGVIRTEAAPNSFPLPLLAD